MAWLSGSELSLREFCTRTWSGCWCRPPPSPSTRYSPSLPPLPSEGISLVRTYRVLDTSWIRIRNNRSVAERCLFRPLDSGSGIRDGLKSGDPVSGSGIKKNRIIFPRVKKIFWIKILKFFNVDTGYGMGKIWIRDGKKSDPGSGINIPDPQHWIIVSDQRWNSWTTFLVEVSEYYLQSSQTRVYVWFYTQIFQL